MGQIADWTLSSIDINYEETLVKRWTTDVSNVRIHLYLEDQKVKIGDIVNGCEVRHSYGRGYISLACERR